jgi:Tfp pilus assembly protein PilO
MSTRQYMLYSVGLSALVLVLVVALLLPQGQEAYDTFNKIQREKPNTQKLMQKLASLDNIPATAEYAQIEVVDKALPSKKPVLELLTSLNTVSTNTGVVIDSFQLSPGLVATDEANTQRQSSGGSFEALEVDVEIAGTFKQVQDFIIQVERVSPFTTVTNMDLKGALDEEKAADDEQLFRAVLTTETYFFTQPISVRIDAPLPIIATPEQSVLGALAAFAPINLQEQTEVQGGGLEELLKSGTDEDQQLLQNLLNNRSSQASGSATTPE